MAVDALKLASPKLSQVLFEPIHQQLEAFAVVPSNVAAAEAAVHFSRGLTPFVLVLGPSGWGKSHLAEGAYDKIRAQHPDCECLFLSASNWLRDGYAVEQPEVLILDDAQEIMGKTRSRVHLRLGLERRVRAGKPTFVAMTHDAGQRHLRSLLPGAREWLVSQITEPSQEDRLAILARLARLEGLDLHPDLLRLLARRLDGNGRSLVGALKRLRLYGSVWNTYMLSIKACGILEPFLCEEGTWGLRKQVKVAAARVAPSQSFDPISLGVYALLREAGVPENDVARYYGLPPSEVYARANAVESLVQGHPTAEACLDEVVRTVVVALAHG